MNTCSLMVSFTGCRGIPAPATGSTSFLPSSPTCVPSAISHFFPSSLCPMCFVPPLCLRGYTKSTGANWNMLYPAQDRTLPPTPNKTLSSWAEAASCFSCYSTSSLTLIFSHCTNGTQKMKILNQRLNPSQHHQCNGTLKISQSVRESPQSDVTLTPLSLAN